VHSDDDQHYASAYPDGDHLLPLVLGVLDSSDLDVGYGSAAHEQLMERKV
jgi:hypothetical protein